MDIGTYGLPGEVVAARATEGRDGDQGHALLTPTPPAEAVAVMAPPT